MIRRILARIAERIVVIAVVGALFTMFWWVVANIEGVAGG